MSDSFDPRHHYMSESVALERHAYPCRAGHVFSFPVGQTRPSHCPTCSDAADVLRFDKLDRPWEPMATYCADCLICNIRVHFEVPQKDVHRYPDDEELPSDTPALHRILDAAMGGPERRAQRRKVERIEADLRAQAMRELSNRGCPHAEPALVSALAKLKDLNLHMAILAATVSIGEMELRALAAALDHVIHMLGITDDDVRCGRLAHEIVELPDGVTRHRLRDVLTGKLVGPEVVRRISAERVSVQVVDRVLKDDGAHPRDLVRGPAGEGS